MPNKEIITSGNPEGPTRPHQRHLNTLKLVTLPATIITAAALAPETAFAFDLETILPKSSVDNYMLGGLFVGAVVGAILGVSEAYWKEHRRKRDHALEKRRYYRRNTTEVINVPVAVGMTAGALFGAALGGALWRCLQ